MGLLSRRKPAIIGVLLGLSFLLLLPNFLPIHLMEMAQSKDSWDDFNPGLVPKIRSVEELVREAETAVRASGAEKDDLQYARTLDKIVRSRFYHGYSYYSLQENWIAALAGRFVNRELAAIVIPDDILKYPMAACSQQSMVMMAALKRKGIGSRKVAFDDHYALEACVKDRWYYFDTNTEPDFSGVGMTSYDSIRNNNLLGGMYRGRADSAKLAKSLRFIEYGPANVPPAPNASLFHNVTKWTSRLLWLLPLLLALLLRRRK